MSGRIGALRAVAGLLTYPTVGVETRQLKTPQPQFTLNSPTSSPTPPKCTKSSFVPRRKSATNPSLPPRRIPQPRVQSSTPPPRALARREQHSGLRDQGAARIHHFEMKTLKNLLPRLAIMVLFVQPRVRGPGTGHHIHCILGRDDCELRQGQHLPPTSGPQNPGAGGVTMASARSSVARNAGPCNGNRRSGRVRCAMAPTVSLRSRLTIHRRSGGHWLPAIRMLLPPERLRPPVTRSTTACHRHPHIPTPPASGA